MINLVPKNRRVRNLMLVAMIIGNVIAAIFVWQHNPLFSIPSIFAALYTLHTLLGIIRREREMNRRMRELSQRMDTLLGADLARIEVADRYDDRYERNEK